MSSGDGIDVQNGVTLELYNSYVYGNEASSGLFVGGPQDGSAPSTVTVSNSHFYHNGKNGIELQAGSTVTISDSNIYNNLRYGMLASNNANVTISKSSIYDNTLDGLNVDIGATVVANDVTITGNKMEGINVMSGGKVTIRKSTISNNGSHGLYATDRYNQGGGIIEATNVIVTGNGRYGVLSAGGDITINGSSVSGNTRGQILNITGGSVFDHETTLYGAADGCMTITTPGTLTVVNGPAAEVEPNSTCIQP